MSAAPADTRVPVFIVTGFLGAGKTTFLRRAQQGAAFSGALLLVNEAAAFGVDDRLLRGDAVAVTLLANGCLCCRIDRGVKEELHRVLALDRGRHAFDRVILELSGLADPLAVIATITSDPYLDGQLRIALVVTLVDCLHAAQSADAAEHRRQIEAADIVLLTKTDLATPEAAAQAAGHVAALQPLARCIDAADARFDRLMEEAGPLRADRLALETFDAGGLPRTALLAHTGAAGGFACAAPGPDTFCLRIEERLDWTRLALWLSLLLHAHGARILRIKGFLSLDGAQAPVLINCVRHIAYFPEHLEPEADAGEGAGAPSFLVFIVEGLSADRIARSFSACVSGRPVAAIAATPAADRSE
ncbi:CobW family GTP-binding protein [Xanthobacter pseudotagetidis]|uniref:CobW family GTP-binding protein n=1 Tax=Xanthobacter pseudotagetidis TaxID=3119911 RepID=UPI003728BC5B